MKSLQVGTASQKAKNHAICEGPIVVAHVLGHGYPVGIGWSKESEDIARVLAASYDLLEALKETRDYARALVEVMILKENIDPFKYEKLNKYASTGLYTGDSALDRADEAIAKAEGH